MNPQYLENEVHRDTGKKRNPAPGFGALYYAVESETDA